MMLPRDPFGLDLDVVSNKWLRPCGACDAGIGECVHPAEDYRPTMLALVGEIAELRQDLEAALSDALDAEGAANAAESWEYFAGLAFAYFDAPEGTDDVTHAWHELAGAINHYRAAGGKEPRDPDELAPPEAAA